MCVGLTRSVEALSAALTTKSNADATKTEPLRVVAGFREEWLVLQRS
jgi:hypothetical protein